MPQVLGTDPGTGRSGFGTTLAGSIALVIGMIQKITIDGVEVGEIDVTTMNAPGKWMKFISNLKDAKNITLDLLYDPVNMTTLLANVGVAQVWTVVFPGGSSYVQTGYIKTLGVGVPYNDKMMQPCALRMSGPPVFNLGSGDT